MNRKHKSGVSIAEMCIVLALLAIVGTLVVSFSLMVSARANAGATRLNAADDLQVSQTILDAWADRMAGLNAQITADETGLSATIGEKTYAVTLKDGMLLAPLPDGEPLSCPIRTAESFRFSQLTKPDGNPLIFCTISYTINNPAGVKIVTEDTFTVLSRVGDRIS